MDPKTLFVITITTMRMIMPGMPPMPKMAGIKGITAPTKTLTMNLTSNKQVDTQSKAECGVPGGLKVGPKVNLAIDLPAKAEEGPSGEAGKPGKSEKMEFTFKAYWGCSETVPPGQPKVLDSKNMGSAMQQAMQKGAYKNLKQMVQDTADGSHAYWPGMDGKQIVEDSAAPGTYDLATNYCGGTTIELGQAQDFLAPMDVVSPKGKVDLAKSIKIEWKPVSNAVAYQLMAFSGKEKEMITWTSSSDPESAMDIQNRAMSAEEVKKLIKSGVLIAPDVTTCYIPEGIFKGTSQPMLSLAAIGADKMQTQDGITTNVLVRSTAALILGGGMDMGMGMTGEDSSEEAEQVNTDDSGDQGDAVDKANEGMDKAEDAKDKVKDTVNKAKRILKW